MTAATRDRTAAERTRRMRERRFRGFFIVGVEVCKSDVKKLAENGFLGGDPTQADKEQIAYAIGEMLDKINPLHRPTPG